MSMKNKKALALILLTSSMGLTGCHQNPITQHKPEKSALILLRASRLAEQQLKIDTPTGWVYGSCMDDNRSNLDCKAFFKAMLPLAKQDKAFKNLTYADLTDQKTFETIAEDYESKRFFGAD